MRELVTRALTFLKYHPVCLMMESHSLFSAARSTEILVACLAAEVRVGGGGSREKKTQKPKNAAMQSRHRKPQHTGSLC